MRDVCVITGGGSGMGLSAAMQMPKEKIIIVSGRTVAKLENAVQMLKDAGHEAYVLPGFLISKKVYSLAETDEEKFIEKCIKKSNIARGDYQKAGFAYALSKNFVVWYAQKSAFYLGEKGIRVCSLSPGIIATDMGKLEEKEGGFMLAYAAEKRMGTPDELGFAIATVADERNGYLAGVDVLVDGGSTNGKAFRKDMGADLISGIRQK